MKGVCKNRDFRPISHFISQMIRNRAIVTMKVKYETVPKLSNGTIFNDIERPLTQVSRSCHYLTLNVSEMVRYADILRWNRDLRYSRASFQTTSSDLE